MTQQATFQDDRAYTRYLADLDSLKLFEYARNSHAGRQCFQRGRGWLKAPDEWTAKLLVVMGKMAQQSRSLLDVAQSVVSVCNPHSSVAEWQAKNFEAARVALSGEYDDVDRRSGPESFRLSECRRPYTRSEKLIVLCALHSFDDSSVPGFGWAAQRCAEELGLVQTIKSITGWK